MGENLTLDSAHNFGIYTRSGKRTIFQIDFSCKRISLIERGKINKTYNFENIDQYDSEENLLIVIRFRNNKTLEFDADTAEEKYTICRLLGIILGNEQIENNNAGQQQNGIRQSLSTKKQVIREGVLEKRGNTKIPTWSRRRLQVCPGEFSYYKPGDEVALNLVQLWENSTSVNSHGHNGFTISVRDRAYQFRVPSEKGINQEMERNQWVQAFKQASLRKRATFLLLEMSKQTNYGNRKGVPLPSLPSTEEEVHYYNQETVKSIASSSESCHSSQELLDELETVEGQTGNGQENIVKKNAINELDEVINDATSDRNRRQEIALSVIQKESPVLLSPTKHRARPPAVGNLKSSIKSVDSTGSEPVYVDIPEPDYSPPSSPEIDRAKHGFGKPQQITNFRNKPFQSSGVYKQEILPTLDDGISRQDSGIYTKVIQADSVQRNEDITVKKSNDNSKPAGAVDVMPKFSEMPKLRKVNSAEKSNEKDKTSPIQNSEHTNGEHLTVKQIQANMENLYQNDKISEKENKPISPRGISKFPPPAPSAPRKDDHMPIYSNQVPHTHDDSTPTHHPPRKAPAPPPPVPIIPAPPPPIQSPGGKGRLKQVHWSRIPKPLIARSIWERPNDMTAKLNLKKLEEQFSLKERETATLPGPKLPGPGGKQLLIDGKRAQNLGIFMSGLKNGGTRKLIDVLNNVNEDEDFPAEKLTTIRRYQPTEDEIDMYRGYSNKRHELHPIDQFMLDLCEIPCLNIRIDICLTLWDFPWQFESTCQLVEQVHGACDELLNSQMLVLVLDYLLAIGNYLNRNWAESNVTQGFQVSSLDKILDVRGKDGGYSMVTFLVEQLRFSDPGLLQWTETIQTVKKCEQVTVKAVAAEGEVLKGDLLKVKKHLKTLKSKISNPNRQDNKFQQDVQNLTVEYEMKLEKLDRRCAELSHKYRQVLVHFGEPHYQRSDTLFAVLGRFYDKFKSAMKDGE